MVVSMTGKPTPFDLARWLQNRGIPTVNTILMGGYNAIHLAAYHCDYHAVVALLAYRDTFKFLNIDSQADNGITPIIAVCTNIATTAQQKEGVIKSMMTKLGANARLKTIYDENIAAFAMRANLSGKFLEWLFHYGQVPANSVVQNFGALIVFASHINSVEYFEAIINQHATTSSTRLRECLSVAAAHGSLAVMKKIVKRIPKLVNTVALRHINPHAPHRATLFQLACQSNQWRVCEFLYRKSPNLLRQADGDGALPIMYAVNNNDASFIERLYALDNLILTDVHPLTGDSALHVACRLGNMTTANELIDLGARIDVLNLKGEAPLHCLASFNMPEWTPKNVLAYKRTIARLIDMNANALYSMAMLIDAEGNTPFLAAAQSRNQIAMDFLANDLPILVFQNQQPESYLPFVSMARHNSMSLIAVETGDSVRSRQYKFICRKRSSSLNTLPCMPPKHHTARAIQADVHAEGTQTMFCCDSSLSDMSEDAGDYESSSNGSHNRQLPLRPIYGERQYEFVARFKRFIVDQQNFITYRGAAHLAISGLGHCGDGQTVTSPPSILVFLYVKLGCCMHNRDIDGNTPFLEACKRGNLPCALWLKHYAGVESTPFESNHFQSSAFLLACQSGNVHLVQWMISQFGCDPYILYQLLEQRDCAGLTPVLAAAMSGSLSVLKILSACAESLDAYLSCRNTKTRKSISSTTTTIRSQPVISGECWKMMLAKHACIKRRTTALLFAAQAGHLPVVEWIVSELGIRACLSLSDAYGNNLMHHANQSRNLALITYCKSLAEP